MKTTLRCNSRLDWTLRSACSVRGPISFTPNSRPRARFIALGAVVKSHGLGLNLTRRMKWHLSPLGESITVWKSTEPWRLQRSRHHPSSDCVLIAPGLMLVFRLSSIESRVRRGRTRCRPEVTGRSCQIDGGIQTTRLSCHGWFGLAAVTHEVAGGG